MDKIVTKAWICNFIQNQPRERVEVMVGRALVVLFKRQTQEEKYSNHTQERNNMGFNQADARAGTLTAKSYLKNGRLADWQLRQWTANGGKRIAKYHRQLNEEAVAKATFKKVREM